MSMLNYLYDWAFANEKVFKKELLSEIRKHYQMRKKYGLKYENLPEEPEFKDRPFMIRARLFKEFFQTSRIPRKKFVKTEELQPWVIQSYINQSFPREIYKGRDDEILLEKEHQFIKAHKRYLQSVIGEELALELYNDAVQDILHKKKPKTQRNNPWFNRASILSIISELQ